MPSKKDDWFYVVYLNEAIEGCSIRVLVSPSNWVKDDCLSYTELPLSADDEGMINSFLQASKNTRIPPPATWPKYKCTILESFGAIIFSIEFIYEQ